MRLAIVFDDLVQFGGAEKLLLAATEIFPEAPVYTCLASKEWRDLCERKGIKLKTSFLQNFPWVKELNKFYAVLGLHVLAYESFDLSGYNVVLSISARFSHGVITCPGTKHICYVNSPGRMFWEPAGYFSHHGWVRLLLSPLLNYLRLWDFSAAQRVDKFVANAKTPQKRIEKYYRRRADVVYPFVEWEKFKDVIPSGGKYFLVVSRLAPWKKLDIAIEACAKLGLPLKVVGEGPDETRLKRLVDGGGDGATKIEFLGYVSEEQKRKLLSECIALLHPQLEDFGLVPLEAMACGKPVIAYAGGGALETVVPQKTGEFFHEQTTESLVAAIKKFDPEKYSSKACRTQAQQFSREKFEGYLRNLILCNIERDYP